MGELTREEIERIDRAYAVSAIVFGSAFLALFVVAFADDGRWFLFLIGG